MRSLTALSIVALAAVSFTVGVSAGGDKITFPEDYAKGVLYTTVDRPDNKQYRELFSTPEAIAAAYFFNASGSMSGNSYDAHLDKTPANYQPLTPLTFLERSATIHPHHVAVIHGRQRYTYAQLYERARRLASALAWLGIGAGDTVSVMLSNTPPMQT